MLLSHIKDEIKEEEWIVVNAAECIITWYVGRVTQWDVKTMGLRGGANKLWDPIVKIDEEICMHIANKYSPRLRNEEFERDNNLYYH